MRSETPTEKVIWDEGKALAVAMATAARDVPGTMPPQVTMPVAAIILAETIADTTPQVRRVLGRMLLTLGMRLLSDEAES